MSRGCVLSTLFALSLTLSCGGDPAEGARDTPAGPTGCAPGELTLPDGRCQPAGLPPDMPCPPGQRALPTSTDGSCQAAGVPPEACAAGRFVPDGRGGCEAILPEEACQVGLMAVPGERACREVSPCGEGPWGTIPVEANTEYVDQGYPGSDSDGSREKPWKTVQAGVGAAEVGAIVAVAEGRYEEDVLIRGKPVRLWGRCSARTVVAGRGDQLGAITLLDEGASGAEVRGLAVTGPKFGVISRGTRSVILAELWIHDAGNVGVVAVEPASVTLHGSLVERNHAVGVLAYGGEATVEATVVRTTQPDSEGRYGRGIAVQANPDTWKGGRLSLTASLVEQNHEDGVYVGGSEARVEATVVRATQPLGAGRSGTGVGVEANPESGEGGQLSLTASLVEQNQGSGVRVVGSVARVEATVVRANQPDDTGQGGRGFEVTPQPGTGKKSELSLTASLVEQNRDVGVFVMGSEATVEATVVRATQPDAAGELGLGIVVESDLGTGEGGRLSLTGSLVEQNHYIGVYVEGSEATVEATVVRATQPASTGNRGVGIQVEANPDLRKTSQLSLTASLVEQNHRAGVIVLGSEATITATVVRATEIAPADENFGDGILVMDALGPTRAVIVATESTDNARAGVLYVGGSGELTGVRASGNRYGLVLQSGMNGAKPVLGESNVFEGNATQDELSDGDLAVPDSVTPLP